LSRRTFALGVLALLGLLNIASVVAFSPPRPVDPPHVQSDCRAACTLEGMELAGVEISTDQFPRCLCAPVQSSGGDL
jgi:hypothetical protein